MTRFLPEATIRHELVVGGACGGLPCEFESDGVRWLDYYVDFRDHNHNARGHRADTLRSLVLPGPRHLGAAGLAWGVAERLLGHPPVHTWDVTRAVAYAGGMGVPRSLLGAVAVPHDERLDDWSWRHLKAVSEYIAATDQLARSRDWTLDGTEVAGWEQWDESGHAGWVFFSSTASHRFIAYDDMPGMTEIPDLHKHDGILDSLLHTWQHEVING